MNLYKIVRCSIDQRIPVKIVIDSIKDDCYKIVKCPICGKYTFNNHSICINCGWENERMKDDFTESSANHMSISEYKKRFIEGNLYDR